MTPAPALTADVITFSCVLGHCVYVYCLRRHISPHPMCVCFPSPQKGVKIRNVSASGLLFVTSR